jgi:hypothetical protein
VRRRRRARWQEIIAAQASYLEYEYERLRNRNHQNGLAGRRRSAATVACQAGTAMTTLLTDARQAACDTDRPGRIARLVNVWSGALVCRAFADLHAAKVVLVDLYAEEDIQAAVPAVLTRLQTCLAPSDQRRQRAEALFGSQVSRVPTDARGQGRPAGAGRTQPATRRLPSFRIRPGCSVGELAFRRAALRDAMQISYDAADEQYTRLRSFRNVLITGAVLLSLLVLAMCLLGAQNPKVIPLCFNPSSTSTVAAVNALQKVCPTSETANPNAPPRGDVAVVALMGVLGAALSATLAVQKLRGTATPYSVPVSLALFKLPAGALTAIAGLLLIKGGFVPGFSQLDSQGQILAYAIAFGVAQHLVTRFVDQRADDVLSSLPSKERPVTKEKQSSTATRSAGGENPALEVQT